MVIGVEVARAFEQLFGAQAGDDRDLRAIGAVGVPFLEFVAQHEAVGQLIVGDRAPQPIVEHRRAVGVKFNFLADTLRGIRDRDFQRILCDLDRVPAPHSCRDWGSVIRIQLALTLAFNDSEFAVGRDGIDGSDADAQNLRSERRQLQVEFSRLARQRIGCTGRKDLLLEQQLRQSGS